MESIIVNWRVQEEGQILHDGAFELNVLRGKEVYLLDVLIHCLETGVLPTLCYEFYGLIGEFPVLLESPSSLLPVTDDSQLNLILVHCGNPPIVRLEYMEMFARLSKILFSGSDGGYSGDGGPATEAMLNTPSDVAVAGDGTIYIADTDNSCIRVVKPDGIIETFAGICGVQGYSGDYGPAQEALLNRPFGVSLDRDGRVYISDTYNSVIRWVDPN